jgi:hypothetical protein
MGLNKKSSDKELIAGLYAAGSILQIAVSTELVYVYVVCCSMINRYRPPPRPEVIIPLGGLEDSNQEVRAPTANAVARNRLQSH